MGKHTQSIENKILQRIRSRGAGNVFTPSHFLKIGSRAAVDKALSRLAQQGHIRRLGRGIYDYPKRDPRFGMLTAPTDSIVKAVTETTGAHVLPSGAFAANALGLSDQVPMKLVYLTDGPSRTLMIGTRRITLKRTAKRYFTMNLRSALIVQALRNLGARNTDARILQKIDAALDDGEKARLIEDLRYAPAWIAEALKPILQGVPA